MSVCTKLRPGKPGTKRLVEKYGAKLLCVRYRYDEVLCRRLKTVELIVDTAPWTPPATRSAPAILLIRTHPRETRLHAALRQAGARWNSLLSLWSVPSEAVVELGLLDRVVRGVALRRELSAIKNFPAPSAPKTSSRYRKPKT